MTWRGLFQPPDFRDSGPEASSLIDQTSHIFNPSKFLNVFVIIYLKVLMINFWGFFKSLLNASLCTILKSSYFLIKGYTQWSFKKSIVKMCSVSPFT